MAIWVCTTGHKREVHTGGLRAMTALQLVTCPVPHSSIYDDKSCAKSCIHTCASLSLCFSTSLINKPTGFDPWHQLPPQLQHGNALCDATLQSHYCGSSLSLAPQHNYSPDEWFGNDRQLELQTVRYWWVHFLPACVHQRWRSKIHTRQKHKFTTPTTLTANEFMMTVNGTGGIYQKQNCCLYQVSFSHCVVFIRTLQLKSEWNNTGRFLFSFFTSAFWKWHSRRARILSEVFDLYTGQTVGRSRTEISGEDKWSTAKQPLEEWSKDSRGKRGRE